LLASERFFNADNIDVQPEDLRSSEIVNISSRRRLGPRGFNVCGALTLLTSARSAQVLDCLPTANARLPARIIGHFDTNAAGYRHANDHIKPNPASADKYLDFTASKRGARPAPPGLPVG
jgi:hypothetical protein